MHLMLHRCLPLLRLGNLPGSYRGRIIVQWEEPVIQLGSIP